MVSKKSIHRRYRSANRLARRDTATPTSLPDPADGARRQEVLRDLEDGTTLATIREQLCDRVREAHKRDQSHLAGRKLSKRYSQAAKELRDLERQVSKSARVMERGILRCVLYRPSHRVRVADALRRFTQRVGLGLTGRASACKALAKYYNVLGTDKASQWGPHTAEAIKDAVDRVRKTFDEASESAKNARWWDRAARSESAEYYVGLLCIDLAILPSRKLDCAHVANVVRARINRSANLIRAQVGGKDLASALTAMEFQDLADGRIVQWFRQFCYRTGVSRPQRDSTGPHAICLRDAPVSSPPEQPTRTRRRAIQTN